MRKLKIPKIVFDEAKNLKKFATKEELNSLNISTLDTRSRSGCIYGQMTGFCDSLRAVELIQKSCKRVYHAANDEDDEENHPSSSTKLNGSPKKVERKIGYMQVYWSPIEVWIDKQIPGFNEKLVAYLKGEKRTLK